RSHAPPPPYPTRRSSDLAPRDGARSRRECSRRHLPRCRLAAVLRRVEMPRVTDLNELRLIGENPCMMIHEDPSKPPSTHVSIWRDRKSTRLNSSHVAISY